MFGRKKAELFERNEKINYLFPSEKVIGFTNLTNFKKYNPGNQLELFIKTDRPAFFIYFDPETGKYELKKIDMQQVILFIRGIKSINFL